MRSAVAMCSVLIRYIAFGDCVFIVVHVWLLFFFFCFVVLLLLSFCLWDGAWFAIRVIFLVLPKCFVFCLWVVF